MFCTQCKVLFSWSTGKIDRTGLAHNPYWYEWQASLGQRAAAQLPGQGCMDLRTAQLHLTRLAAGSPVEREVNAAVQLVGHLSRTQLEPSRQAVQRTAPTNFQTNLEWRCELLQNNVTREKFNHRLLLRYSRHNREQAKMEVLEAFHHMALDVIRAMATSGKSLASGLREMHQLRGIMQEAMVEISDFLRCQVPLVSDNWQVYYRKPAVKSRPKKPKPAAGEASTSAAAAQEDGEDEVDDMLAEAFDSDEEGPSEPAPKAQRTA